MIANNQLLRAVSTLEAYINHSSSTFNEVLFLRGQVNLLETQKARKIISPSDEKLEHSKLSWTLMDLADNLKFNDLLQNGSLNEDYTENWGLVEYFVESIGSLNEYLICLQKMDAVQKHYLSDLDKAKKRLDFLKTKKKVTQADMRNATLEIAGYIHHYIEGFSPEIRKFDTLTVRSTYSSFKTLEFMVEYNQGIDIRKLRKTLKTSKDIQKIISSFEESLKKSKALYDKRFAYGKELNAASLRASSQHDMFISKCKSCVRLLDIHHENLTIVITEYLMNNNIWFKIMQLFGYKRRINKKTRNLFQ